jgi:hypothetical protein
MSYLEDGKRFRPPPESVYLLKRKDERTLRNFEYSLTDRQAIGPPALGIRYRCHDVPAYFPTSVEDSER